MIFTVSELIDDRYHYKITIDTILNFHQARIWLTGCYGFSENLDNKYWAWSLSYKQYEILLKSKEELTWFNIKWL